MADSPSRVILDPSVLFEEDAFGWTATQGLSAYLVVSGALRARMEDPGNLAEELEAFGVSGVDPERIETVRQALEERDVTTFSYERAREEGELFGEGTIAVCDALLEIGGPLAEVLADEWAFVTSQSLAALAERTGRALGAFAHAGATLIGVPKQRMVEALDGVRDKIPPGLLAAMKSVDDTWDRCPKLLLAGGELAVHFLVPPLGIAAGVAEVILAGNAVLAGDP